MRLTMHSLTADNLPPDGLNYSCKFILTSMEHIHVHYSSLMAIRISMHLHASDHSKRKLPVACASWLQLFSAQPGTHPDLQYDYREI